MKRNNTTLMDRAEFGAYTKKTIEAIGSDSIRFFTTIGDIKEEAARFFKFMYGTLPTRTIEYLGVMVKLFDLVENYEIDRH